MLNHIIVPNLIWNKHTCIYFQAQLAAGQGGNALQDMSAHTPHTISRIEEMGNAKISSLNESTASDVSRSLQTINQSAERYIISQIIPNNTRNSWDKEITGVH